MLAEFQALIDEVTAVKEVSAAAVVAINGVVARLNEIIQGATDLEGMKAAALAMVADLENNVVQPLSAAIATVPPE